MCAFYSHCGRAWFLWLWEFLGGRDQALIVNCLSPFSDRTLCLDAIQILADSVTLGKVACLSGPSWFLAFSVLPLRIDNNSTYITELSAFVVIVVVVIFIIIIDTRAFIVSSELSLSPATISPCSLGLESTFVLFFQPTKHFPAWGPVSSTWNPLPHVLPG